MSMQTFTFLISLFFALTISAQEISVKLYDGTQLDCSASKSLPAACKDANNTRYIVEASAHITYAIGIDSNNNFTQFIPINEVKVDDQIIFASPPLPPGFDNFNSSNAFGPPSQIRRTHRTQLMVNTGVLTNLSHFEEIAEDAATKELIKEMRELALERNERAQENAYPKNLEVEFEDGTKTNCKQLQSNFDFPCLIYKCGAPNKGYYIEAQFGVGSFVGLANDEVSSLELPKVIWSERDRTMPVVENFTFNGPFPAPGGLGGYGGPNQDEVLERIALERAQRERQTPALLTQAPQAIRSIADPGYRMNFNAMAMSCKAEDIAELQASIDKVRKKIADSEVVQLVEVSSNILTSRFINPSAVPDNACRDGETWYRDSSYDLSRAMLTNASPKTISMDVANRLFNEARAMDDIAWDYKMDGCYARAHLMARRFEEQGIHVDKVWIKGELNVPSEGITWNFHVAPVVYVESGDGKVERMVIDPSLSDRPLTVDQWSAIMRKGVIGDTVETSYPFPHNAASLERTAIAFSNSDPYLPYDPLGMSEAEKMQQSTATMERYLGYTQ